MQKYISGLLLVLVTFGVATGQTIKKKKTEKLQVPTITLVYTRGGTPFDQGCGWLMNKPALQKDMDEAFQRLNEFQLLWDKDGTTYLQTAIQEIGVSFPYKEMLATLTVCDMPSVSTPLIFSIKQFLSSSPNQRPVSTIPMLLFHEVMHTYPHPVYTTSALRKKYASETNGVLNHLHLMALEKFVLTKLNKTEVLQWLDDQYRNLSRGDLKRAWEIVNDIEGYEVLLKELKSMKPEAK